MELGRSINKYCEPFVGGGAVLFDILTKYELKEVLVNDINSELVNVYNIIKNDVRSLIARLEAIQCEFISKDKTNREKYYYLMRETFNDLKVNGNKSTNLEKAAILIFLNKTCFNGLFRVNSKGLFNVPMGSYKNPLICDKDNLKAVSTILKNVVIKCGDYAECLSFIDDTTFVYIDPPYRPLNQTSSFNSYNKNLFDDKEQIRLGNFVKKICSKNAQVLLSNSDPKNTDIEDNFFDNIYKDYNIERITAKRMINCNSESRGSIKEILISNIEQFSNKVCSV